MTLQSNFQSSSDLLKEFVLDHLDIKPKRGIKSQIIQTDHVERLVVFAYKIIVQYCLFPTINLFIFNSITLFLASEICNPLLEKLATFCAKNIENLFSESRKSHY